jgi:bacterioferritin-associated ferredoxin
MCARGVQQRAGLNNMNLCHCNSLTEAQIRESIADGARTVEAVFARWRCGQLCGACRSTLLGMLAVDARRRARKKARPAER